MPTRRYAASLLASTLCVALISAWTGCDEEDAPAAEACWLEAQAMKAAPGTSIQETWGAACKTNADCVALLGDGAICDQMAVIYELPGGYCTKPCTVGLPSMPNNMSSFELDDPECDPAGGVHCVGANGNYTRCAPPCTDDSQCAREGYFCRLMPSLGVDGDPTFCLMSDCCEGSCTPSE